MPLRAISQKSRSHPADWVCTGPSWMPICTCQGCWRVPSATSGGWPRNSAHLAAAHARRPRPEQPEPTAALAAGRGSDHRRPEAGFRRFVANRHRRAKGAGFRRFVAYRHRRAKFDPLRKLNATRRETASRIRSDAEVPSRALGHRQANALARVNETGCCPGAIVIALPQPCTAAPHDRHGERRAGAVLRACFQSRRMASPRQPSTLLA